MTGINCIAVSVIVSVVIGLASTATILPTTIDTEHVKPTTTIRTTTTEETVHPELFKKHLKKCSTHDDCSCTGGYPVCYNEQCNCIYTRYMCGSHQDCATLCQSKVGVCFFNACKCYSLVEDVKMSESISPMMEEVPPH